MIKADSKNPSSKISFYTTNSSLPVKRSEKESEKTLKDTINNNLAESIKPNEDQ